ncbi:MAG: PilZ domain-containing protein, partial [Terriglobales bacterium]
MPENPADHDRLDHDHSNNDRLANHHADNDRRRSVRFICGGYAQISRLPSDGIFVPGKIRDLSLHGCCVDTPVLIDCGTRAEIVVRVNATSFRAVGEVKAIRGRSVAGMEFVQLSAGGKDLLADMVTDLAKLQAIMNQLRNVRREMDAKSFQKQLEDGKRQAAILSERFPFLGTIFQAESSRATSGESAEPKQLRSCGHD